MIDILHGAIKGLHPQPASKNWVLYFSAIRMNCSYLVRNFVSHTLTGSSGRISFHNLKPGFYILKVHAYNRKLDVATLKILLEVN